MFVTSAREVRLLNAALWRLGLDELVPCETQQYSAFVHDVLSRIRALMQSSVFQHAAGVPIPHSRSTGAPRSWRTGEPQESTIIETSTSFKSRLQQFQRASAFFLAHLGVELDLRNLLRADGNSITQVLELVGCLIGTMHNGAQHQGGRDGISMKDCEVGDIQKTCQVEFPTIE